MQAAIGWWWEQKDRKPTPLPVRVLVYPTCGGTHEWLYGAMRQEFVGEYEPGFPPDFGCLDAPDWLPLGSTRGWGTRPTRHVFPSANSRDFAASNGRP